MITSDISRVATIILVAGGISLFALLIAKLCQLRNKTRQKSSKYECGFKSSVDSRFRYCSEKSSAIAMYLILELAMAWLMICFAYHIYDSEWNSIYFIKILSGIILISLIISVRALYSR